MLENRHSGGDIPEAVEADRAEEGPEVDPLGEGHCRHCSSKADASL